MKKKILIIASIIVVIATVGIIVGSFYFKPTPIVRDVANSKIIRVQITDINDKNGALIDVKDYNEAAILNYLSTCTERRTLERAGIFQHSQVTIEIWLDTKEVFEEILLGEINYRFAGTYSQKYEILNAKEVKETLLKILDAKSSLLDMSAIKKLAENSFEEHLKSLNVKDYKIIRSIYKNRAGDLNHFVCSFEADVVYQDNTADRVEYSYFIVINNRNELEIRQEGPNVDSSLGRN